MVFIDRKYTQTKKKNIRNKSKYDDIVMLLIKCATFERLFFRKNLTLIWRDNVYFSTKISKTTWPIVLTFQTKILYNTWNIRRLFINCYYLVLSLVFKMIKSHLSRKTSDARREAKLVDESKALRNNRGTSIPH